VISELEFNARDYHLLLMVERMQRDGRSEEAIAKAVRTASGWRPIRTSQTRDGNPGNLRRLFRRSPRR
jgi:hypothetical protein